jgi:hypothetical protein
MKRNLDFENCIGDIGLATKKLRRCEGDREVAIETLEKKQEALKELLKPIINGAIELYNSEVSTSGQDSGFIIVQNYVVQLNLQEGCFVLRAELRDFSGREPDYELDTLGDPAVEKISQIFYPIITEELSKHGISLVFRELYFPNHYYCF